VGIDETVIDDPIERHRALRLSNLSTSNKRKGGGYMGAVFKSGGQGHDFLWMAMWEELHGKRASTPGQRVRGPGDQELEHAGLMFS
jgi:hypothetical protein